MIDTTNPMATPFRLQASTDPKVDYEFSTAIITSADGSEQRRANNRYPKLRIRYQASARSEQHAARTDAAFQLMANSALAIMDFRMTSSGRVSADGWSVTLNEWQCSWAAGVRVVCEDYVGMVECTSMIASVDPVSRTITLGTRAPFLLRGKTCKVGSAVVASIDEEMTSDRYHDSAIVWDLGFRSFGGLDPIGGAALPEFPFRHGSKDAIRVKHNRSVGSLDFGIGRRQEFLTYASAMSGFRTYEIDAYQMDQSAKEDLISFFCGCRGRHKSFAAPNLLEGARFRFASDILSVTHLSGNVSKTTMNLAQIIR